MPDAFKTGQSVTCTVTSLPKTEDDRQTLERLMRRDPGAKRGLRKSQRLRRQNMVVYNRGNRDWVKRERVGKIVRVAKGQTWTMRYTPEILADLRIVKDFISIAGA